MFQETCSLISEKENTQMCVSDDLIIHGIVSIRTLGVWTLSI
jgi:hypothetical protein